jgi:hypothetical protein
LLSAQRDTGLPVTFAGVVPRHSSVAQSVVSAQACDRAERVGSSGFTGATAAGVVQLQLMGWDY